MNYFYLTSPNLLNNMFRNWIYERDALQLSTEAEELKSKYLSKYKTAVVAAQEAVRPVTR